MRLDESNTVLTIDLIAQTPMIHFQYEQEGATLRASDVKPRLDNYLIHVLKCTDNLDDSCFLTINSLDYKMKIREISKGKSVKVGRANHKKDKWCNTYWGDIDCALVRNCKITIICFHKKLMEIIMENIDAFFNIYNFGTMQSKAFGGFSTLKYSSKLTLAQIKTIGKKLKETYQCKTYYYVNIDKYDEIFEFIDEFYKGMKADTYFNNKDTGKKEKYDSYLNYYLGKVDSNEKVAIKEFAKKIQHSDKEKTLVFKDNRLYLRSLLGLASTMDVKLDKQSYKFVISNKNIERCQSPIYFKYIGKYLFIIAKQIPDIYDKEFKFTYKSKNKEESEKTLILKSPSKDMLDIDDFLEKYISEDYGDENIKKGE